MITISLNGETRHSKSQTLEDLLLEFGFGSKVATARNGDFVPAILRVKTHLQPGDQIEVLAAMQGG